MLGEVREPVQGSSPRSQPWTRAREWTGHGGAGVLVFAFVTFLIENFWFSISFLFFLCKRGGGLYHFEDASLTCLLSSGQSPPQASSPPHTARHSPGACRGLRG